MVTSPETRRMVVVSSAWRHLQRSEHDSDPSRRRGVATFGRSAGAFSGSGGLLGVLDVGVVLRPKAVPDHPAGSLDMPLTCGNATPRCLGVSTDVGLSQSCGARSVSTGGQHLGGSRTAIHRSRGVPPVGPPPETPVIARRPTGQPTYVSPVVALCEPHVWPSSLASARRGDAPMGLCPDDRSVATDRLTSERVREIPLVVPLFEARHRRVRATGCGCSAGEPGRPVTLGARDRSSRP